MATNPSLGAASGFANAAADAYGQGLRFAIALRQAAAQQQQQQQIQRQKAFDDELRIRAQGGVPYTPPADILPSGNASGLIPRDPKMAKQQGIDPSRITTDAIGRQWVMPDPDARKAAQNAAETSGLLLKGARPVDAQGNVQQMTDVPRFRMDENGQMTDTGMFGVNAAAPPERVVTPAGGKQGYYVPTDKEQDAAKIRSHLAAVAAEEDQRGWGLPDVLADSYEQMYHLPKGSMRGVKLRHEATAAFFSKLGKQEPPPKQEKEPSYEHWINVATDPNASAEDRKRALAAIALHKQRATAGGGNEPKPASPAQLKSIVSAKHAALAKAEQEYLKAVKPQIAGIPVAADEINAAREQLRQAKQAAQDQYEESLMSLGYPVEHLDVAAEPAYTETAQQKPGKAASPAAPAPPPSKPAAPSAQKTPAPAKAAPKTARLIDVRDYAKARGITEAAALKAFKAAGYSIGQ